MPLVLQLYLVVMKYSKFDTINTFWGYIKFLHNDADDDNNYSDDNETDVQKM